MKSLFYLILLGSLYSSLVFGQSDSAKIENISTPLNYEIVIYGGGAFPYLPSYLKHYGTSGWSAGIGCGISLTPSDLGYITLYTTIDYNKMKTQYADLKNGVSLNKGTVHITNFMANMKGTFAPTKFFIEPYFIIGLGAMNYNSNGLTANEQNDLVFKDKHKLAFAWTFGVGIEIPITKRIGGFVEGKSLLGIAEPSKQIFPVYIGAHLRF
jgi:hypothetical protein